MPKSESDVTVDQPKPSDERTTPLDSHDRLDWDACLDTPAPRRSGTIKVRLNFLRMGKRGKERARIFRGKNILPRADGEDDRREIQDGTVATTNPTSFPPVFLPENILAPLSPSSSPISAASKPTDALSAPSPCPLP
jgi:hypothetical protein